MIQRRRDRVGRVTSSCNVMYFIVLSLAHARAIQVMLPKSCRRMHAVGTVLDSK